MWKKLGIKPGTTVCFVNPREGIENKLGKLPEGVTLHKEPERLRDLTVWFTDSRKELETRIHQMVAYAVNGGLWIAWRKKAAETQTDVSQALVREVGLASGLVDYKISSIDETWSALRFTQWRPK